MAWTDYLWSGIDPTNLADGGPECLGQVSLAARAALSVPALCLSVFLLFTYLPRCAKTSQLEAPMQLSAFIRGLGWVQIIGLLLQLRYKLNSGTAIYMLMPCHLVGVLQTFLCFRRDLTLFRVMVHYGKLAFFAAVDHRVLTSHCMQAFMVRRSQ